MKSSAQCAHRRHNGAASAAACDFSELKYICHKTQTRTFIKHQMTEAIRRSEATVIAEGLEDVVPREEAEAMDALWSCDAGHCPYHCGRHEDNYTGT